MFGFGIRVPVDTPRLVVVLPVQRIPAVVVVHELLPGLEHQLEVGQLPGGRRKLVEFAVVDVDVVELEDHVDLVAIVAHRLQHVLRVPRKGHLAHAEGIVLFQNLADVLQILVQPGPVRVVAVRPLPDPFGVFHRRVGEALVFADEVDHVHPKAIRAFIQPEPDDIVDGLAHGWMLPVQVRLLLRIQVKIVFACVLIVFPGTAYIEIDS